MKEGKKLYRHGNHAKIDPNHPKRDVPVYLTYLPTQTDIVQEGQPGEIGDTKVYLSKKAVDENHK